MDNTAEYTDPVATVTWTPPLYPDTVEMQTGHTREAELEQLRAELQTALQEKADVEVERAVTVLELEKARKELEAAQARAGCYLYRAERVEAELKAARESRARLVCYLRGIGGGHDTNTETT